MRYKPHKFWISPVLTTKNASARSVEKILEVCRKILEVDLKLGNIMPALFIDFFSACALVNKLV